MSSDISAGAVMVVGGIIVSAVVLMFNGSGAAQPQFDYSKASFQERTEFLETEAKPIETSIRGQMGNMMKFGGRRIDTNRRHITFRIEVDGILAQNFSLLSLKSQVYAKLCPGYVTSKLGRSGVTVVQKFVSNSRGTLLRLPLSTQDCQRHA